jgi:hypothetical protein
MNKTNEELQNEIEILQNELEFSRKVFELLSDYRKCLTFIINNCNCDQKIQNRLMFNKLQNSYKIVFENNNKYINNNCNESPFVTAFPNNVQKNSVFPLFKMSSNQEIENNFNYMSKIIKTKIDKQSNNKSVLNSGIFLTVFVIIYL